MTVYKKTDSYMNQVHYNPVSQYCLEVMSILWFSICCGQLGSGAFFFFSVMKPGVMFTYNMQAEVCMRNCNHMLLFQTMVLSALS